MLARDWPGVCTLDHSCYFHVFLAQIHLHTFLDQHMWNLSINYPILTLIPFDAWILCKNWWTKWVCSDRQQHSVYLIVFFVLSHQLVMLFVSEQMFQVWYYRSIPHHLARNSLPEASHSTSPGSSRLILYHNSPLTGHASKFLYSSLR